MPTEKKSIFDKAIDALTDRDEKAAAAEKAAAEAKAAADAKAKADAAKAASAKAALDKAAADKAAAAKAAGVAAADKAAADKMVAAQQEAMKKMAESKSVAAGPRKGTVTARSLHIRKEHSSNAAEVGGLTKGQEVNILETWTDGKDTWGKLGPDQWAAIVYKGETYIKLA